jgi:4-amino-4-deoxy-L-arabinose transferase-like glycosyltransferase
MSSEQIILWTSIVLIALASDLLLHQWLRAAWRERGVNLMAAGVERAAAAISSMLDGAVERLASAGQWLRAEWWRRLARPRAPQATAPSSPAEAPANVSAVARSVAPGDAAPIAEAQSAAEVTLMPAPGQTASVSLPPAPSPDTVSAAPTPRVARVHLSVDLPEGTAVRVTLESLPGSGVSIEQQPMAPTRAGRAVSAGPGRRPRLALTVVDWRQRLGQGLQRLRAWTEARAISLEMALFALGLGVYVLTRLIGLTDFPIYFFTDEAIEAVQAENFIRSGFRNSAGELFPTYFQNGPFWNLSVRVYAQVIPYLLFGNTIFVVRATTVALTLLGAVAVALTLKRIFKTPYWWSGALLLSIAPAWFLHSRTAFETAEMSALYACFLYFYLRYRCDSPRYLFAALLFGALAFYAYSPGQMVMLVTGLFLLVSDLRYHWQHRRIGLAGVVLLAALALPLVRHYLNHPGASYYQLRERGSLLVDPRVPLDQKITITAGEYLYGLSPTYWYLPNQRDISRHIMKGYANLPTWSFPLAVVGLVLVFRNIRSPAPRTLLLALLATPTGGALAEIGITRVLMFVIPATLIAALGLAWVLEWVEKRGAPRRGLAAGLFVVLAGLNVFMLRDALVNGPTWFTDYSMGGMQYGMKQLFEDKIPGYLARDPNVRVLVSPSWANGTDVFHQFFFTPEQQRRVDFKNVDYFVAERRELTREMLLVMPFNEYQNALQDPKLANITVDEMMPYPDGSPGFYFARLEYSAQADALFEQERLARQQPVTETIEIDDQVVTVTHTQLGGGQLRDLVDGDPFTVLRGVEANPIVFDFQFPAARPLSGVTLTTGTMADFTVTLRLYAPGAAEPTVYAQSYRGLPDDPSVTLQFGQAPPAPDRIVVEILDQRAGPAALIHVREVTFNP